ncbi:MAG TPA: enolase C-terminal domain-like protein [Solirubrobacteraceae bacterium]|nr:enolase C-terminal domain-like protein [Solirubrobacteraceae bacterium]
MSAHTPSTVLESPLTRDAPRITGVELLPVSSPLKHAFTMREETLRSIDSVLIKLHTDAGIVGIADSGNVSPWYLGETQESIMAMVATVLFPEALQGQPATQIERIVARMDFLCRENSQAKALIDYALHDIKGQLYGVPVYELLGGRSTDRIKLAWVMSAAEPEPAVDMARAAVAEGFDALKLKTGHGTLADDIEMVAAVREAVGPEIKLWVDINGHWIYQQALDAIRALEPYDMWFIEQPLPEWDLDGAARLRARLSTPIYLDESARTLADVQRIIRRDAADGLMIKVPKAGGLLKSQQWIALAQSAGLSVMCGCMAGCGFEAAVYSHLLCSNAWASRFAHENLGPLHIHDVFNTVDEPITDDLALEVPRYQGGHLYPTEGPGIGVELNEPVVAELITPGKDVVVAGLI